MIYQDLLRLAQHYLKNDRARQMIQATTLVHEAYLRLFGKEKIDVENRAHFFVIATRQMRRILIDLARRSRGVAFSYDLEMLPDDLVVSGKAHNIDLIALDEALTELEKLDERACRVVELRYIAGLTVEEVAEILDVSIATVKRDWTFARTWLFRQLR